MPALCEGRFPIDPGEGSPVPPQRGWRPRKVLEPTNGVAVPLGFPKGTATVPNLTLYPAPPLLPSGAADTPTGSSRDGGRWFSFPLGWISWPDVDPGRLAVVPWSRGPVAPWSRGPVAPGFWGSGVLGFWRP